MSYEKEILALHKKGFVILKATRTTNAPVGWKRPAGSSKRWGYVEEMTDPLLKVYKSTFKASILSRSHCGFYLGHGDLCCIDLDTKKVDITTTKALRDKLEKTLKDKIVIESTKSNGYHIYFKYGKREDNIPDWTGKKSDNWIELYYSKRFIACYLSNSKKYMLEHGSLMELEALTAAEHKTLLKVLAPYKGKVSKRRKSAKVIPVDQETWNRAEAYVKQVEEKGLDITGDNPTWFKIGKAFANAFGAKGFDMFNRLSQFSTTYNEDTIQDTYERFVLDDSNDRKTMIRIGTFFKICNDYELYDLETLATLKALPAESTKEFELTITKKETMPEKVHTLVTAFLQHVEICCLDNANFFIFDTTHWVKINSRELVDLINSFVDRSTVDPRFIKPLRTLPYLEMTLREIKLITQRDALEPRTGNLKEGIFINMENGVLHVNLQNGKRKLLDHEASYNFTTILPFCYDPTVKAPRFDKWMSAQIPDTTLHEAYYAFVASCLTRHKADIIMLLAGDTSTGKSSLIDITRRVIGLENSVAVSAGILFSGTAEAQTQAMQMENKLLAYDFDSQPFKHLEMLLKVAAQEPLPGWQMHVTRRPVVNYGRLLIAMNPYNYSVFNAAVARRFITINMDIRVEKDNAVMPAIYENELAGIFNHVLNTGVKHLVENGGQIAVTDKMKKATLKFHTKSRDAIRWLESKYVVLEPSTDKSNKKTAEQKIKEANPGVSVILTSISSIYTEFRDWMEFEEGWSQHKLPLRKHFAADIKLLGIEDSKIILNNKQSKYGFFIGIKD